MLTTLLVIALALLLIALFTPIDFRFRLERRPDFAFRLGVRWLFGRVGSNLEKVKTTKYDTEPSASEEPPQKQRKTTGGRRLHLLAMLRAEGFVLGVTRLVLRLIRAGRFRHLFVWLRAGFDDPADTGLLSGWLLPLSAYFEAHHPGRLDLAPDFTRGTLELILTGDLRVVPANLLWPVLVFSLSPSTLRGLVALGWGRNR